MGELANAIDSDPGYVSRLLSVLADELLIRRTPRKPIERVEWEATLRQLASNYSLLDSNETTAWVASAGPEQFIADLANNTAGAWAVTGSFAASSLVSVTVPRMAVVYVDDAEAVADLTHVREVRTGGNVILVRPYHRIVFERTRTAEITVYASPAQTAVDCLTGPGRMPAEGEALLEWMRRKAPQWQAPSLAALVDPP